MVVVSEAHSLQEDDETARPELPHFVSRLSPGERPARGGLAVLVRGIALQPDLAHEEGGWRIVGLRFVEVVAGRVAYVGLAVGAGFI